MKAARYRFEVFLSHNSVDKPHVETIAQKLRSAGINPWLDKWCLIPGAAFQHGLADGLRECPTCAVFIGREGLGNWAREELLVAQDRAAKESEFLLIPILLPGVPDPFEYNKLPPFLAQRTWVDFRPGLDEEQPLHALVNAIRREPPGQAAVVINQRTNRLTFSFSPLVSSGNSIHSRRVTHSFKQQFQTCAPGIRKRLLIVQ